MLKRIVQSALVAVALLAAGSVVQPGIAQAQHGRHGGHHGGHGHGHYHHGGHGHGHHHHGGYGGGYYQPRYYGGYQSYS